MSSNVIKTATTIFSVIIKVGPVLYKITRILKAGEDIISVINKEDFSTWQKTRCIAADCFLILAEGGSLYVNSSDTSSKTQLTAEGVAGGADLLQRINTVTCKQKITPNDIVDLGCCLVFRVSYFIKGAVALKPILFGEYREIISNTADLSQAIADGVMNRDSVINGGSQTWKGINHILNYFKNKEKNISEIQIKLKEEEDPVLEIEESYADMLRDLQTISDLQTLTIIPEIFQYDEILTKFKCPISQEPIRFPMVVITTEQQETPVYYERANILKYLQEKDTRPPNWPINIEFNKKKLKSVPGIQNLINNRITTLLNDIKTIVITNILSPIIEKKARIIEQLEQIGINQTGLSSADIVDKFIDSVPKSIVTNLFLNNFSSYLFSENTPPKKAKCIQLKLLATASSKNKLTETDLYSSTLAILGSPSIEDFKALKQAIKHLSMLKIYFSDDFQDLKVE